MITTLPAVLGYSFESIDRKIEGLRARGFKDPVKMILSPANILGYSFKNIDRKMRFARRVGYDPFTQLIEYCPMLIGLSLKRYFFVVRMLQGKAQEEITFSCIVRTSRLYKKKEGSL